MKQKFIGIGLLIVSSVFSVVVLDMTIGKFMVNKLLGHSWLNWRNNEDNFSNTGCYKLSPTLGFEPVWGSCNYPGLGFINNLVGDKEVLGVNSGQKNILIIGDSNTARSGYAPELENRLNSYLSQNGFRVKITKVGVESYNTKQEVGLLKESLYKLSPDLLVLQFTENDFDFSPVAVKVDEKIVYFSSQGEKSEEKNPFLFKNSNLYRLFTLRNLLIDKTDIPPGKISNQRFWDNHFWDAKVENMDKTMGELKSFVDDNHINIVFLVYPKFDMGPPTREAKSMLDILDKYQIPYLDLRLYTEPFGGPYSFHSSFEDGSNDSVHPQRNFDTIVSEVLFGYISKNL